MTEKADNKKLSIIVPAYKVEAYIEKCIRSLEDQDLPKGEYEIIVVNDGSPYHCKEIVEGLQKEFSNIILINQENQGVSMARNNAIAKANGKYVIMVDADDRVYSNSLSSIIDRVNKDDLDVLYLGYEIYNMSGILDWRADYNYLQGNIFNGVDGYYASAGAMDKDPDRSAGILLKKDLLTCFDIGYPNNVPYLEDGLFLVKVLSVANRVGFDSHEFYQRTTRVGSATNSNLFNSERAIKGFIIAASDLREFASRQNLNQEQRGLINQGITKFVILPLHAALGSKRMNKFVFAVKNLRKEGFKKLDLNGVSVSYLQYAKQYNISPLFFAMNHIVDLTLKKLSMKKQ